MIYHKIGRSYMKTEDEGYDLSDLGKTVTQVTKALKPHIEQFDSIVVTGMSGVLVGAPVSLRLKKPLVVLRKESDDSHHGGGRILNECNMGNRVLFLDDFVACGTTRLRVKEAVSRKGAWIVGTFLYCGMEFSDGRVEGRPAEADPVLALPEPRMLPAPPSRPGVHLHRP